MLRPRALLWRVAVRTRKVLSLNSRHWVSGCVVAMASCAFAQSPDATVIGSVVNNFGEPVATVKITATNVETGWKDTTLTNSEGEYSFEKLRRGQYSFEAEKDGYQRVRRQSVEVPVSARLDVSFTLYKALNSADRNTTATELMTVLPPPPLESLASSVSVVVSENEILRLPLASRNIYSLFLLQPGVTSQGAIVRRGLSFSVHGQRVSGSNYLLDGVDNNDTIVTGPLAAASAEAVQEFRMVNSNFSAEYGRATAFVAQVVTRSGTNRFHGSAYEFLSNDKLNANTFQNNANDLARASLRYNQFGFSAGGPIQKNKTFFTSVLEFSRLRFPTSGTVYVPTSNFIANQPANSTARLLLTEVPPIPAVPTAYDSDIGLANYTVPNHIDTLLATERLDKNVNGGKDRLTLRYTLATTSQQIAQGSTTDMFTGYPSLRPTDQFQAHNSMLAWTHSFNAGIINEVRAGWSRERVSLPRPRSDIPLLQSFDLYLPGSPRAGSQTENDNVVQLSDTVSLHRGRSSWTAGFEFRRNLSNRVTWGLERAQFPEFSAFPDGFYSFPSVHAFAADAPIAFSMSVDSSSPQRLRRPNLRRDYRSSDYAAFLQNVVKLTPRVSINIGVRYEYFGVPHSTDAGGDTNFYFGPGAGIAERVATGGLRSTQQNPGDLKNLMYRRDRLNFAPSIGLAWDMFGRGRTILRAGYAVAYDRVFDTLRDLRANDQQLANCIPQRGCELAFLLPADRMLQEMPQQFTDPPSVIQLDENLRTPYAENWFFGVQQAIGSSSVFEIGHSGSVGRKLISRETVNRYAGTGRLTDRYGDDTFLSNEGNSNYLALELSFRRRFNRGLQFQAAYTYSHAIDNQSDTLEGIRYGPGPDDVVLADFTRQFDARVDRGNANFDQRHNLVFASVWNLPAPRFRSTWQNGAFRGWTLSLIGGYRSGFPVTVIVPGVDINGFDNNRADYTGGVDGAKLATPYAVPGGVQWLDPNVFAVPTGHVGTLGRGALPGPGFWNYDIAVNRDIALSEGLRLEVRGEFYNAFNHANLSIPNSNLSNLVYDPQTFGRALYGINQTYSRFGELPLASPARRIQLGLRFRF
jgi:hypothetical protein